MIYKRVAARLQAQDWLAITIELTIVVVGVFIGMQDTVLLEIPYRKVVAKCTALPALPPCSHINTWRPLRHQS